MWMTAQKIFGWHPDMWITVHKLLGIDIFGWASTVVDDCAHIMSRHWELRMTIHTLFGWASKDVDHCTHINWIDIQTWMTVHIWIGLASWLWLLSTHYLDAMESCGVVNDCLESIWIGIWSCGWMSTHSLLWIERKYLDKDTNVAIVFI